MGVGWGYDEERRVIDGSGSVVLLRSALMRGKYLPSVGSGVCRTQSGMMCELPQASGRRCEASGHGSIFCGIAIQWKPLPGGRMSRLQ